MDYRLKPSSQVNEIAYLEPALYAARLRDQENLLLFESVMRHEHLGRWSFLACNPSETLCDESLETIRHELADRTIEVVTGTSLAYRVATMQAKGMVPNYEASTSKLFGSELGQRIALTGMHLLGTTGQLRNGSKHEIWDQASSYLQAVSGTVAAGTSEIQRGIIATRGLGLPRG